MDTIVFRQHLINQKRSQKGTMEKQTQQNIISNVWRTIEPNSHVHFGWLDLMQKKKEIEISISGVKKYIDITDVTVKDVIHLKEQKGTKSSLSPNGSFSNEALTSPSSSLSSMYQTERGDIPVL